MPDYVAVPHLAYNWMTATYFFLGGLGAGSFLLSLMANYWKQEFKPVAKVASLVAPIATAVGMFFLWIHLGQPFRVWRLFLSFNPRSVISWGVWFLNIFFVLSLIYAWFLAKGESARAKRFAYFGLPFAILVSAYPGLLLMQSPGRALWHSALVPVLFLNGALISALAGAILLCVGRRAADLLSKLGRLAGWLILLELALVLVEVLVLMNGGTESVQVAKALLAGAFSFLFLGVQIALGAVIPLLILLRSKASPATLAVASALVLVGIFTMRYIIVIGGQVIN